MRTEIIETIYQLMQRDENIYFLTGDLGFSVLEAMEKKFPKRFINVGIAEQNMIGLAAGLALTGKQVFVYSVCTFLTMRAFEHIRDCVCYHNLNVRLLGIGSGLSYGVLGSTHYSLEDVAILRSLPNMTILAPADGQEGVLAVKEAYKHTGPLYLRIGKKEEPIVFTKPYPFKIGKAIQLTSGKEIAIITSGTILSEVLKAKEILRKKHHLSITVLHLPTIKPIDSKSLIETYRTHKIIFTIEEHSIIGGLGTAVIEALSSEITGRKIIRLGTPDKFLTKIGTQSYQRHILKLDAYGICQQIVAHVA